MIKTLAFLRDQLKLDINSLCRQLRSKVYPVGSDAHQGALKNLLFCVLLVDELDLLFIHRLGLIKAMKLHLAGEAFISFPVPLGQKVTIYQYCRMYFESVNCPLGSATNELSQWVSTYAERQQQRRKGFDEFFPNLDFLTLEKNETGEDQLRAVTDAELFESKTQGFLRDIEASNALEEFNQRMNQAYQLLKEEAPIVDILSLVMGEQDSE